MKVPAITTNPPPTTTDTIRPKRSGVFTMASTDRPAVRAPAQNPTTPVVPRMRAATAQRTPINTNVAATSTPSTAASLHPNVMTRSPQSLTRKTRAESVASSDLYHHHHHTLTPRGGHSARPSSAASNRSFVPSSQARLSHPGSNGSAMFFHASEAGNHYQSTPTNQPVYTATQPIYTAAQPVYTAAAAPHVPSSGPKFFHANGASVDEDELYRAPRVARVLGASPQINANGPVLAARPSSRIADHSPPSSRPPSVIGYPTSPRPASVMSNQRAPIPAASATPGRGKFVYANGTEELLPPRGPSSEIGSATTSPQLPSSPMFGNSAVTQSPPKVAYPLSPLASPNGLPSPPHYFQRHASHSSSRRSSLDTKQRRGRNASISSVIDMSSIPMKEENGDADDEGHSGSAGESGSSGGEHDDEEDHEEHPAPALPLTAAERIKAMEERAANSRRERKVMDLEISNASLLAINKTLEREMRKQTAELRRYKRLARSGKLSTASLASKPRSGGSASGTASESENASVAEEEDWEVDESEDEDTETEALSEEDEDTDSKSEGTANDDKHREADEKRLTLDLSKHQTLLEASAKMNKSLRGCLLVTDQLIKEGKKALEYKVRASDVRIGGRILRDEEDEYLDLESIDGDGLRSDFSAASETDADETEAEEMETETEDDEEEEEVRGLGVYKAPFIRPEELRPVRHTLV